MSIGQEPNADTNEVTFKDISVIFDLNETLGNDGYTNGWKESLSIQKGTLSISSQSPLYETYAERLAAGNPTQADLMLERTNRRCATVRLNFDTDQSFRLCCQVDEMREDEPQFNYYTTMAKRLASLLNEEDQEKGEGYVELIDPKTKHGLRLKIGLHSAAKYRKQIRYIIQEVTIF